MEQIEDFDQLKNCLYSKETPDILICQIGWENLHAHSKKIILPYILKTRNCILIYLFGQEIVFSKSDIRNVKLCHKSEKKKCAL